MKTGWMHTRDENSDDVQFAPRTLVDSVQDNDGTPLRDMLGGDITIDSVITPDGTNAVNSIAVIDYMVVDNEVTPGSTNAVSGDAVSRYVNDSVPAVINNLDQTVAGSALDATQGKVLNDKIPVIADESMSSTTIWSSQQVVDYFNDQIGGPW